MPYQIIYSSQATNPMSTNSLEEILTDARVGNKKHNITGVLVYFDGVFVQILEGDKDAVCKLMVSIARDSRHHSVKIFYEAEVEKRAFESWNMAYLSPTAEEITNWAGLEGAVTIDDLLAHLHRDPDRVPRILVSLVETLAEQ
jgi:hypothetical protein